MGFATQAKTHEMGDLQSRCREIRPIYADANQPTGHRIKAAGLAIGHETPKVLPEPRPLDLVAEESIPLAQLVEQRRARQKQLEGQLIEVNPNTGAVRVLSKPNGGNGSNAISTQLVSSSA